MADNNQDRSQDEGQGGIDRETEQRNRENETGQQKDQEKSETGEGPPSDGGFVGSGQDNSSDYLTKGEEDQDLAPEGQDTSAGRSDIETGQPQDDDGSDPNH